MRCKKASVPQGTLPYGSLSDAESNDQHQLWLASEKIGRYFTGSFSGFAHFYDGSLHLLTP